MRLHGKQTLGLHSIALLLALLCIHSVKADTGQTATYIDLYGLPKSDKDQHYSRTHEIFKTLKRVSGQASSGSQLVIVNSDGDPWAIALADGNVVLSARAVDIIYSAPSRETGDAWMAFVLGHELAHIQNGDHWFRSDELDVDTLDPNLARAREHRADNDGFLFASLAGYDTSQLLYGAVDQKSFFHYWAIQTGLQNSNSRGNFHGTGKERTEFLKERLRDIQSKVNFFDYGVRLAHFARYEDALLFFREFQRHFKSSAALSNLGYIYLQLARQKMPRSLAYRFWFPTLLETEAGLPWGSSDAPPRSYFGDKLSPAAIRDLEEAVILLSEALAVTHAPVSAHLNLAVAYWYLGEMYYAKATVKKALQRWPENIQLAQIDALVLLGLKPSIEADTFSRVKEKLEALVLSENTDSSVLFNLARLLGERGRHGDAKRYWYQLLNTTTGVPAPYRAIACGEYEGKCSQQIARKDSHKNVLSPPPVSIGAEIDDPKTIARLRNWKRAGARLGPVRVDIYTGPAGDSILALDYVTEIYSSRVTPQYPATELRRRAGQPDSIVPSTLGSIWTYGNQWAAVMRRNQLSEVWLAK